MANKKMKKQVEKQVSTMTPTQLRLTVKAAQDELNLRRDCWVHEMYERFRKKDNTGMAFASQAYNRHGNWETDRIVVTCFTDKSRSAVTTGVARLSPGDSFDFCIGVAIAFARAMGEEVPDLF